MEPEVDIEMMMMSSRLKEASLDLLFKVAAFGNSELLGNFLTKSPEKVNTHNVHY